MCRPIKNHARKFLLSSLLLAITLAELFRHSESSEDGWHKTYGGRGEEGRVKKMGEGREDGEGLCLPWTSD